MSPTNTNQMLIKIFFKRIIWRIARIFKYYLSQEHCTWGEGRSDFNPYGKENKACYKSNRKIQKDNSVHKFKLCLCL